MSREDIEMILVLLSLYFGGFAAGIIIRGRIKKKREQVKRVIDMATKYR